MNIEYAPPVSVALTGGCSIFAASHMIYLLQKKIKGGTFMSKKQVSSIFKKCATCEYYSGNREAWANWVKYEPGNGSCSRPPYNSPGRTQADLGCSYWKKWGALR